MLLRLVELLEDNSLDIETLEKQSQYLFKSVDKYQKENEALRKEVIHLKELLTFTAPLINKEVKIEVPLEQSACEIQLRMLHEKSKTRELTLEETKRLEILIKSLYLIKDKATGINISDGNDTSIEDLTKIAENGSHPDSV